MERWAKAEEEAYRNKTLKAMKSSIGMDKPLKNAQHKMELSCAHKTKQHGNWNAARERTSSVIENPNTFTESTAAICENATITDSNDHSLGLVT